MPSYGLKYYAEFQNIRKQKYNIGVYERDFQGTAKIMGDLCGCALEVQGNMGDIISPIIKTQLRFSLVDSYDTPDTQTTKYGDWQEFFTPDSNLYKVVLGKYNTGTGNYDAEWSGYITPDSWQESLDYRGAITITARDGIGHLKDFPFEASGWVTPNSDGLIQIYDIFLAANQVIDIPMTVAIEAYGTGQYSADVPETSDAFYLTDAYVNAELFDGMNWYDVLEQTLDALGFTFRFVGGNKCVIACLRNLPKLGNYSEATHNQDLEFYGGTLELDPAVKKIEEEQDYKHKSEVGMEHMKGLTFNATTTYRCKTDGNTMPGGGTSYVPEHDADMNTVAGQGQTGWDIGSGMLDPSQYEPDSFLKRAEGEEGWRNYAFIASNQVLNSGGTSPVATYRFRTKTSALKLTFKFTPNPGTIEDYGSETGKMKGNAHYSLSCIKYYVMYTDGTTTRYWNGGSWTNTAYLLTKDYDAQNTYETDLQIELAESDEIDSGTLVVEFGQIIYKMWVTGGHGCYARLAEIKAEINGTTALKSNKVTTINNSAYNILLNRKPIFGALSREMGFVKPSNYLAGMFYYPVGSSAPELFPYMVRFTDMGDLIPLPVLIHEQILCYYFGAARMLNGAAAVVMKSPFCFNKICSYKGHDYLFQGGTLDLFTGIINSACFREYVYYHQLWDGSTPSYSEDTKYND